MCGRERSSSTKLLIDGFEVSICHIYKADKTFNPALILIVCGTESSWLGPNEAVHM